MVAPAVPPDYSGAGLQALRLAATLSRQGRGVTVLSTSPRCRRPRREWVEGVPVIRWPITRGRAGLVKRQRALALASHLTRHPRRYGIVHLHGAPYLLRVLSPIKRALGVRIVYKATMSGADDAGAIAAAWGSPPGAVDSWICIAGPFAEVAQRAGVPAARIIRIPNGVDLSMFRPLPQAERQRIREQFEVGDREVWVTAGAVVRRKRLELLIEAWPRCDERKLLFIVGSSGFDPDTGSPTRRPNPYLQELHERVERLGLRGRVRFLGARSDMSQILGAADGFVFASRQEGSPNTVVEALAAGLPVVSTPFAAASDLKRVGGKRIRFVSGDSASLGEAIQCNDLSPGERPEGISEVDLTSVVEKYQELYNRLLE